MHVRLKKKHRVLFIGLSSVLWLIAVATALETYQRLSYRRPVAQPEAWLAAQGVTPDISVGPTASQWVPAPACGASPDNASTGQPPNETALDSSQMFQFVQMSPGQRLGFVDRHFCIVLELDKVGELAALYAPSLLDGIINLVGLPKLLRKPEVAHILSQCRKHVLEEYPNKRDSSAEIALTIWERRLSKNPLLPLSRLSVPGCLDAQDRTYLFLEAAPVFRSLLALHASSDEEDIWATPWLKYKKNLRGETPTNNFGFYDDDFLVPKPKGLYRVLCIGGSTTEGRRSNAKSYPKILEEKCRALVGQDKIEVLNCGTPGICSIGHVMRLQEYLSLEPDAIVFYVGANEAHVVLPSAHWVHSGFCLDALAASSFMQRHFSAIFYPSL